MKVTRSILKQLILETMNETPAGTSSGTPTQDTGDGKLARADAAAVVAAGALISKLLTTYTQAGRHMQDVTETDDVKITYAAMSKAEQSDLQDTLMGLAELNRREQFGNLGATSSFVAIANFKDSKSKPGVGDKDAVGYSNLMAAAMDMGDLADKWGSKVPAWAVGTEAQDLKDAAFNAHAALVGSMLDDEPSAADLLMRDY